MSVPDDLKKTFNSPFPFIGRMTNEGDWSLANNFRLPVHYYTRGGHTWVKFVRASPRAAGVMVISSPMTVWRGALGRI